MSVSIFNDFCLIKISSGRRDNNINFTVIKKELVVEK